MLIKVQTGGVCSRTLLRNRLSIQVGILQTSPVTKNMIKQHLSFDKIPDETVLWQYMSLTKFLFLIKNKKLHLHRIDDFDDKDEGVLSVLDKKTLSFYRETKDWENYLRNDRKRTFISCWIKCPIEQSLMWYAYGRDGIAIRTTAGAIRCALNIDNEHVVYMIGVRYIDKKKTQRIRLVRQ